LNVVREEGGVSEGRWIDDKFNRLVGSGERVLFRKDNWLGGGTLENFLDYFGLASDKEISVAEMFRLGWDVGGKG
jgi:hypothetical protein